MTASRPPSLWIVQGLKKAPAYGGRVVAHLLVIVVLALLTGGTSCALANAGASALLRPARQAGHPATPSGCVDGRVWDAVDRWIDEMVR